MTRLKKTKSTEHTYAEIEQNKHYKAETKTARSITGKKRVERQQKSLEILKKLKPRYLTIPTSKKK